MARPIRLWLLPVLSSVIVACGEHADRSPLPTQPPAAPNRNLAPDHAALEARINTLINALYAPKDQGRVFAQFAQVKARLARGATTDATAALVSFFGARLADLKSGGLQDPNGAQPPTTLEALTELLDDLAEFAGLPAPIPSASALGPDGAVAVVGSSGGTVVTGTGFGGVQFPPGALPDDVVVIVSRLPNPTAPKSGPLPTSLDQYPLFYDFSTFPAVAQFAQPVTVGVCQLEVGEPFAPTTQSIADRLQVAHPDPANPATVQLLARTTANFIHCDGVSLASAETRTRGTGLTARALALAAHLGQTVAAFIRPTPAYAVHGGLGGLTSSFSPFGAVDPGVSIVGVCSSPMAGVTATYPTIPDAMAAVAVGGVIRVCPQTVTIPAPYLVTKPVTIEASNPSLPPQFIVNGTSQRGFVVVPAVQGSVTFRSLSFTLTTGSFAGIYLGASQTLPSTWWEVTVENNTFSMPNGAGRAVVATPTAYAHPRLNFQFNQITGGVFAVQTLTHSSTSDIEVVSNSFGSGVGIAVSVDSEAFARVANNVIGSCNPLDRCVRLIDVGTGIVTNNTISIASTTFTQAGIAVMGAGSTSITNNSILGGGLTGPATDTLSYRFRAGAILVGGSAPGLVDPTITRSGSVTVSSNIITNAATGVRVAGGGTNLSGTNNVISQTNSVVRLENLTTTTSNLSITGSDFTSFVSAIQFSWPNAPGTIAMQCNWWGTAAGPLAFAAGVPSSMYEPFATGPVANGAGGQCNGTNP